MPFTAKTLADGTLATTETALFTATATTYVRFLSLFNDNAAQQTIQLWIRRSGGTSRKWRRYVLDQNESAEPFSMGGMVHLSIGDSIRASTTTASAVPFVMSGVEET